MPSHRRFLVKCVLTATFIPLIPAQEISGTIEVDLRFGGILVAQVPDVVPYPVNTVSQEDDRIPGTNHTIGGHSVRSLASLNSGPL